MDFGIGTLKNRLNDSAVGTGFKTLLDAHAVGAGDEVMIFRCEAVNDVAYAVENMRWLRTRNRLPLQQHGAPRGYDVLGGSTLNDSNVDRCPREGENASFRCVVSVIARASISRSRRAAAKMAELPASGKALCAALPRTSICARQ